MLVLDTLVTRPYVSTVIAGTSLALPYVLAPVVIILLVSATLSALTVIPAPAPTANTPEV